MVRGDTNHGMGIRRQHGVSTEEIMQMKNAEILRGGIDGVDLDASWGRGRLISKISIDRLRRWRKKNPLLKLKNHSTLKYGLTITTRH